MDEFLVVKIMNESMLRLKKEKKLDYDNNKKIKEFLKDREFFSKVDKAKAMKVLSCVGIADDKLEETYLKLTRKH